MGTALLQPARPRAARLGWLSHGAPLRDLSVAGQRLSIFVESAPMIAAMLADIRSARRRVWLETYIFLNDAAGRTVGDALMERARAGLDVRLMYDALGSQMTPGSFFRELAAAGVKVHAYHTLWEAVARFSFMRVLNRRNHRKLLVIDDRSAYFGGMNIVDQGDAQVLAGARDRSLPSSAGWRDVHVRLEGAQQAELADHFERLWRMRHRQRLSPRQRSSPRDVRTGGEEIIQFFDSRPRLRFSAAARVFTQLFRRAQRSITMSMAYFLPSGRVLRELWRARKRGVKVRVIIPGESDVKLVEWATRHFYAKLLKRGIRLYERKDHMLHSKVLVVDDRWTVVGSCNLDPRSLWINLEFLAVVHSRAFAGEINRICAFEMRHSTRITMDHVRQHRWWQRLLHWFAWSFRSWL